VSSGRTLDLASRAAYRDRVAEWLTIEVVDGEFPASRWRRSYEDALIEAALTHGVDTWEWHVTRWGVVLELSFRSDEHLDDFRALPVVRGALDAVPDRAQGLIIYRGRGGGAGARVPRRPRPRPMADAAALPEPPPDQFCRLGIGASDPDLPRVERLLPVG
jgi:hypothetical protein